MRRSCEASRRPTSATAYLDARLVPWRPRARVLKADTLREGVANPLNVIGDSDGLLFGLALWLTLIIAAPLIVLALAAALLSIEVPLVLGVALLVLTARFVGLIPWTVMIVDPVAATERRERHRTLWRATSRIRRVNGDRRVRVRWAVW